MLTSAKRPVRNRVVSSYSSPCIANMADRLFLHHCSHGITGFPSPLPDNNGRLHSDDPSHEPNMIRSSHVTYIHTCKVFDICNNHGEALRHIHFNKAPELCIYIDLNRIVNDAYHVLMYVALVFLPSYYRASCLGPVSTIWLRLICASLIVTLEKTYLG
jgi:hypothetical protein